MDVLKISGVVTRGGSALEGAYLDLLDASDAFIAERRTGPDGSYSFHTTPGTWTVVCRVAGADAVRKPVVASEAGEAELSFAL